MSFSRGLSEFLHSPVHWISQSATSTAARIHLPPCRPSYHLLPALSQVVVLAQLGLRHRRLPLGQLRRRALTLVTSSLTLPCIATRPTRLSDAVLTCQRFADAAYTASPRPRRLTATPALALLHKRSTLVPSLITSLLPLPFHLHSLILPHHVGILPPLPRSHRRNPPILRGSTLPHPPSPPSAQLTSPLSCQCPASLWRCGGGHHRGWEVREGG